MFEFKILQCPDRSQLGNYEHNGDELIVGSGEGEMVIDDPHLGPSQIKLYFQGTQALLQNLYTDCEVKLNAAVVGDNPVPLKARDSIHLGKTTLNILKVKLGPLDPPQVEDLEKEKFDQRFKAGSRELAILRALEALVKQSAEPLAPPPVQAPAPPSGVPKAPPIPPVHK